MFRALIACVFALASHAAATAADVTLETLSRDVVIGLMGVSLEL